MNNTFNIDNTLSEMSLCSELLQPDIPTHTPTPTYTNTYRPTPTYTNTYRPTPIISQDDHTLRTTTRANTINLRGNKDGSKESYIGQLNNIRTLSEYVYNILRQSSKNSEERYNMLQEEYHRQGEDLEACRGELQQLKLEHMKYIELSSIKQQKHEKEIESLNTRLSNIYTELDSEHKYWQSNYGTTTDMSCERDTLSNLLCRNVETNNSITQNTTASLASMTVTTTSLTQAKMSA